MLFYKVIYRFILNLYFGIINIASFFNAKAQLFVSGRRNWRNTISESLKDEKGKRIWIHCASLGEFEQGRPVIEAIKARFPACKIILTFFSPSGYEAVKKYNIVDYVFYLPKDSKKNADDFLFLVKPELSIFVKYELWYYFLFCLKKQAIPTLLLSAVFKKDKVFFKWYGTLHREMLTMFACIFVQDTRSKELLQAIGLQNVLIGGDTRFDRVRDIALNWRPLDIADQFCKHRKILLAGSTWPEDEQFLRIVFEKMPVDWKLVIVPHEIHDAHIRSVETLFQGETIRWSAWEEESAKRVLIVDAIGFLSKLYKYARVAWIGGGFGKEGVHNVLEAAVFGKPCFFGPVFHQFVEAEELVARGCCFGVRTEDEFVSMLEQVCMPTQYIKLCYANAEYVAHHTGATEVVMEFIAARYVI